MLALLLLYYRRTNYRKKWKITQLLRRITSQEVCHHGFVNVKMLQSFRGLKLIWCPGYKSHYDIPTVFKCTPLTWTHFHAENCYIMLTVYMARLAVAACLCCKSLPIMLKRMISQGNQVIHISINTMMNCSLLIAKVQQNDINTYSSHDFKDHCLCSCQCTLISVVLVPREIICLY